MLDTIPLRHVHSHACDVVLKVLANYPIGIYKYCVLNP